MLKNKIKVRIFGIQHYEFIANKMEIFTKNRTYDTYDEIWFLQHFPVFTVGKSNNKFNNNFSIMPLDFPVIKTNRGGGITFHGPGQQIIYFLFNLKKRKWKLSFFIMLLENILIDFLRNKFQINAYSLKRYPGIYVDTKKICSFGFNIKNSCSSHGFALNVSMDMKYFLKINPCGIMNLKMTQISNYSKFTCIKEIEFMLLNQYLDVLNNI